MAFFLLYAHFRRIWKGNIQHILKLTFITMVLCIYCLCLVYVLSMHCLYTSNILNNFKPPPPLYHMTTHYVLRRYFQEFVQPRSI